MREEKFHIYLNDQRMMFAVLTMVHTADSKEQLDNDTEALLTTARKHLCQFAVLKYQQMDGLNTAMPFGTRKIDAFRTLTTESLGIFFSGEDSGTGMSMQTVVQEINQELIKRKQFEEYLSSQYSL